MTNRNLGRGRWVRTAAATSVGLSLIGFGIAAAQDVPDGDLVNVVGPAMINGQIAVRGVSVPSDSNLVMARNSSAIVDLGDLGKIELLSGATVLLHFTDQSLMVTLDTGRVRVSATPGVTASVVARDATTTTNGIMPTEFTVDVHCGNTWVTVAEGAVAFGDLELAAGQTSEVGTIITSRPCIRNEMPDLPMPPPPPEVPIEIVGAALTVAGD